MSEPASLDRDTLVAGDPGHTEPEGRYNPASRDDMPLTAGTRVGFCEVLAKIGEGGMGEVYRARDTKLHRDVALKVLAEGFARDAERSARFDREAHLLASLNHPNIGGIYGIEEGSFGQALVLELIEGPTLGDRIAEGPIPVAEALVIAKQILEALDAAHERGIVHRDLKPANVKLTPSGLVKVLDFGLAKAVGIAGFTSDLSRSPTSLDATRDGVIVGTVGYMSPEQARGSAIDKRTDLWAFGCLLYEMLTGRPPFKSETISDTIAAVLERQPKWEALPASTPGGVRKLLRRCLQKDPKLRQRDAGDAVSDITDALMAGPSEVIAPRRVRTASPLLLVSAALIFGGLVTAVALWIVKPWASTRRPRLLQFVATAGNADALAPSGVDRDVAISPDGTRLAYVAGGPGQGKLVTRALSSLEVTLLSDRGSPRAPFFSADGQWVGFFELFGVLKKIPAAGGPAIDVSRSVVGAGRGATWGPDDQIIFATSDLVTGLLRVPARGGEPEILTRPDGGSGELDHVWPEFLPGGRVVLFTIASAGSLAAAQIAALDIATGKRKILVRGGSHAQYLPTGQLVYGAGGSIYAVPFNLARLEVTGSPVKLLDNVAITPEGGVNAMVSRDGTLAYVRVDPQSTARALVWVTRDGREDPIAAPRRPYIYPRVSPDGTRVAVEAWDQERDIWVWDLARETMTRLTDSPGRDGFPVWTPDGRRIIFGSAQARTTNLFWRLADGTGKVERLTESSSIQFPYSISRDGTRLVFREDHSDTGLDLAVMALPTRQVTSLIQTSFNDMNGEISPDGRWLAYQSTESGQDEIYVRPFPDVSGGRSQVSNGGGTRPLWSRNGRELFYFGPNGLHNVPVTTGSKFDAGRPVLLIARRYFAETAFLGRTYDIAPDGQRFLMIKSGGASDDGTQHSNIIVVQDWLDELKRVVPPR